MALHDPEPTKAFETNKAAKREALADRIVREKAAIDAEQARRVPIQDDFWRFRIGTGDIGVGDPAFGPNSHNYWGR